MFESRDFGLDELERDKGGASVARGAATYDVKARKRLHTSAPCDQVDTGDFSGVDDVAERPRR